MAAGDSFVSICNIGMYLIGADRINALTDPTKRAIFCNDVFHPLRREILRIRKPNFAKKRVLLAASTTPPPFDWANAFPLPADYITFLGVGEQDEEDVEFDWTVENNAGALAILTDEASTSNGALNCRYIYDCQDPTLFDPVFVRTLGARVGLEAAGPLGRSLKEKATAQKAYDDAMSDAGTASSQENSPEEWDDDVLLRSRL